MSRRMNKAAIHEPTTKDAIKRHVKDVMREFANKRSRGQRAARWQRRGQHWARVTRHMFEVKRRAGIECARKEQPLPEKPVYDGDCAYLGHVFWATFERAYKEERWRLHHARGGTWEFRSDGHPADESAHKTNRLILLTLALSSCV